MLGAKERVDDEDFGSPEAGNGFLWNCLRIGDVSQLSDPIREDRDRTVRNRYWQDLDVADDEWNVWLDDVGTSFRFGRARNRPPVIEDVGELAAQTLERLRRAVHGEWCVAPDGEGAKIIDAVGVVEIGRASCRERVEMAGVE